MQGQPQLGLASGSDSNSVSDYVESRSIYSTHSYTILLQADSLRGASDVHLALLADHSVRTIKHSRLLYAY